MAPKTVTSNGTRTPASQARFIGFPNRPNSVMMRVIRGYGIQPNHDEVTDQNSAVPQIESASCEGYE